MINSPTSGEEFRSAIIAKLSPGEQLVSFADCFTEVWAHWDTLKDHYLDNGRVRTQLKCLYWSIYPYDHINGAVDWKFLSLTNINIRLGVWKWKYGPEKVKLERSAEHKFRSKKVDTMTAIPEIYNMTSIGLDDIVSVSDSTAPYKFPVARLLETRLGQESREVWSQEGCHLKLTLTNGHDIELSSPFVEMEQLVADIDAAKSGALIVKNTQAAASALDQLVPLLEDGILTQEEFDRAKDGFLGGTVEVSESSVGLLRQIHSLHQSGVLSESEFNMKKWDILSKVE